MPFDHAFLASLPHNDPEGWGHEIHDRVRSIETEIVGALLTRRGRPVAITQGPLAELHACEASPGGLLGRGLWLGADGLLPFHTQVTVNDWEIDAVDLAFAARLRDLAQLFGCFELWPHLLMTGADVPIALGRNEGLQPPASSVEMGSWERGVSPRPGPRYRHPVTGQTWAGSGTPPPWIAEAKDRGLRLEDFEVPDPPATPDVDRLDGVPRGVEQFRSTVLQVEGGDPGPGWVEISGHAGFEGAVAPADWVRALLSRQSVAPTGEGVRIGVLFGGQDDHVLGPRAGWLAEGDEATRRPGLLFRSALEDGAVWAVTFTAVPASFVDSVTVPGDLLRRLVFLGRLLGLAVRDHLVVRDDGRWLSVCDSDPKRWPPAPPVDEPLWPPFRRKRQAKQIVRHPHDGRVWRCRGPRPGWLRDLLADGWSLDELRQPL